MRAALLRNLQKVATRSTRSSVVRPQLASTTVRAFAASASGGTLLKNMTKENPHIDVVRYEHKNRKWTLNHVDYYSEALAIGFLETGLRPGDAVLCWLPSNFSETVRCCCYYLIFLCLSFCRLS